MGNSLGHLLECKLLCEVLYSKIVLVCSKKTTQRVNVYLNETSAKLLVYEFAYIITPVRDKDLLRKVPIA